MVTNANGCTATSIVFTVTWVSISENVSSNGITIYPNPVSDNFIIELTGVNETKGNILITNALGQIVKSEIIIPANDMKWSFNVSDLQEGIYFVHLQLENKTMVTKMVIER
jgi:hypothetical protein